MQPLTDALAGAPRQLRWTDPMTSAFRRAKERLAKAALLFHPVHGAELWVHTDACSKAIAGAVHQVVNGKQQPLGFFSWRLTSAESKYSAYVLELLAVYATIVKFRHMPEGRTFKVFTDQKPLTRAFLKARDPVSNRQRNQLAFISEYVTEFAHVPGLENVVADTLSRQYDDEPHTAVIHSVVHTLVDVNLEELAREQRPIDEEPSSSLQLVQVKFPGVESLVVCDKSLGRPRILVPEGRRRAVFEAIHGLAHPSGKSTLGIITRSYVWENVRWDVMKWVQECQACAASKVARHVKPEVRPIPVLLRSIYLSYIFVHSYSSHSSSYEKYITRLSAIMASRTFF